MCDLENLGILAELKCFDKSQLVCREILSEISQNDSCLCQITKIKNVAHDTQNHSILTQDVCFGVL